MMGGSPMSPRNASYLLFAAGAAAVVRLDLGQTLLAGLFSYTLIDAAYRRLARRLPEAAARWLALLIFAVAASLLTWMLASFVKTAVATIPTLLATVLPRVVELARVYRVDLPFDNIQELRNVLLDSLKEHVPQVTHAGGLVTKRAFQIVLGVVVAALAFMAGGGAAEAGSAPLPSPRTLYDELRREFAGRAARFMGGFEKVIGAQVTISAVNTLLTAVFLLFLGFPHVAFLIPATFVLGILPIIGNILSNTVIVGTALTLSPQHAVFALGFLVFIHKGEYFLNSRIIGGSIDTPMWVTLMGILAGESVMGVPGIILAPALIHYVREELRAVKA